MGKKIITVLIVVCSLIVLLLVGLYILSSNYKLVCFRYDSKDIIQNYSYEFTMFGKLKKFSYETILSFESDEAASEYYEKIINSTSADKDWAKLNKNIVVLDNTHDEQKLGNNIFELKKVHKEINYLCEVQKK